MTEAADRAAPVRAGSDPLRSARVKYRAADETGRCCQGVFRYRAPSFKQRHNAGDDGRRGLVGLGGAVDQGAHQPQRCLGAFDIASDPEQIVGGAARQQAGRALDLNAFRRRQQRGFSDRAVRQHPGVGRRGAALQANRPRVGAFGDPHKSGRHHLPALADLGEEQPQRERARLQTAVAPHRHARKRHRFLRHIIDAAVADRADQRLALRVVELRAQNFVAAAVGLRFKRRRDHHAIEVLDHFFAHVGAPEPPGGNIRYRQIGAEHVRRQRGQERQHRAGFHQAGAERIDDDDLAVTDGLQQPRNAEAGGGIEFERVGKVGIDAPQQNFSPPQAGNGPDENAIAAHASDLRPRPASSPR